MAFRIYPRSGVWLAHETLPEEQHASTAKHVAECVRDQFSGYSRRFIEELRGGKFAPVGERAGRAEDKGDGGGLETLRRDGYR